MKRIVLAVAFVAVFATQTFASTRFEKLFYEGKLAESQTKLETILTADPKDEEAHFALGFVRFLRAHEKITGSLYEHGFRTDRLLMPWALLLPSPFLEKDDPNNKERFKPHPNPKILTHPKLFAIIQTYLDDMEASRLHLRKVQGGNVQLTLVLARIKLDLFGTGNPSEVRTFFGRSTVHEGKNELLPPPPIKPKGQGAPVPVEKQDLAKPADPLMPEKIKVCFDRADAAWLCGYCHFISAIVEAMQSLDGREHFERHAHLFFSKVETPYKFLLEEPSISFLDEQKNVEQMPRFTTDWYSNLITASRLPVKEPERLKKSLAHLEGMVKQSRQMWKWILEETDDDHEWIPSPKQKGALGVKVTQEMVDRWLEVVDEVDDVLKGKKLIPFWRGKDRAVGFQFRRVLTEPAKDFNVIGWIQGTSAAPYLEKGPMTRFTDPNFRGQIDRAFGGSAFFGYAAWFN